MLLDVELASGFLDPLRHEETVKTLAARYLAKGNWQTAFMFADRACRAPNALDGRALLLRSEAARGLSESRLSEADLTKAAALDPLDPLVLRVQFKRGGGAPRTDIAKRILASSSADRELLISALAALDDAGFEVITKLSIAPDRITGWILWKGNGPVCADNSRRWSFDLTPDSHHRLGGLGWSAVDIDRPGTTSGEIDVRTPDRRPMRRLSIDRYRSGSIRLAASRRLPVTSGRITVIVPLFDGPRLATLCLGQLARQKIDNVAIRVVLVQDNPGHAGMTAVAERAVARYGYELIENPRSLGFAGAVNRALAASGADDDILLLNSDVLLPPGAIGRLALVARCAPDIGTVTPLSNNGEEASFPSAILPNAMGSMRAITALDAVAATVNAKPVTLPNGIGFCLYISRRLLDRVGPLPEIYDRGYYEDVEFCLRGAAAGLRNICAPNVCVGHKGSASFKDEKRGLVVRNRKILEGRFPGYGPASASFFAADPLRIARREIEFLSGPMGPRDRLVLVPPSVPRRHLLPMLGSQTRTALFAGWAYAAPNTVEIFALDGANPQSLRFAGSEGREKLTDYLTRAAIRKLLLLGACLEQRVLVEHLHANGMEIEIVCDESLLQVHSAPSGIACDVESSDGPCLECAEAFKSAMQAVPKTSSGQRDALGPALGRAQAIHPINAMAATVVDRLGLARKVSRAQTYPTRAAPPARSNPGKLGVLVTNPAGPIDRLIDMLIHDHPGDADARQVVVLGRTLDDIGVMSSGRAFVTGDAKPEELEELVRIYGIGALFAPARWSGYGDLERFNSGLPWAYFDWSGGVMGRRAGDLDLDPRACDRKVVHQVRRWLVQSANVPEARV